MDELFQWFDEYIKERSIQKFAWVRLRLENSNHKSKPLRTEDIAGLLVTEPIVGGYLKIMSRSLDDDFCFRFFTTSAINRIENQSLREQKIETENSVYMVEYLGCRCPDCHTWMVAVDDEKAACLRCRAVGKRASWGDSFLESA